MNTIESNQRETGSASPSGNEVDGRYSAFIGLITFGRAGREPRPQSDTSGKCGVPGMPAHWSPAA